MPVLPHAELHIGCTDGFVGHALMRALLERVLTPARMATEAVKPGQP
ncbi:hypothetical protein [Geothrix campi]|nr:hypothetical protein [Geothrix sp. SG10]